MNKPDSNISFYSSAISVYSSAISAISVTLINGYFNRYFNGTIHHHPSTAILPYAESGEAV